MKIQRSRIIEKVIWRSHNVRCQARVFASSTETYRKISIVKISADHISDLLHAAPLLAFLLILIIGIGYAIGRIEGWPPSDWLYHA